jgi:hypothetical protein
MNDEENITLESLSDESQLNSADDNRTVGNVAHEGNASAEELTLGELNSRLGKDFKDKETALKALKDTFSFVGKRKEDIEKEVLARVSNNQSTESITKELAEMRKERFFDKNPDLAPFRQAYEKVGGSPEEFFNSEAFKPLIEKAKGYDESQKLRTVLESNPRLASSKDSLTKANDLKKAGGRQEDYETLVARAVLDAYDN